jgi:hypothetical protein
MRTSDDNEERKRERQREEGGATARGKGEWGGPCLKADDRKRKEDRGRWRETEEART